MLKKYLQTQDYSASDDRATIPDGVSQITWKESRRLSNLASTARINLILQ